MNLYLCTVHASNSENYSNPAPDLYTYPTLPFTKTTTPQQTWLVQISEEAKEHARSTATSFDALEASYPCQACTRFPELEQYVDGDLPTEFDWRDYGAVTSVKNQVGVVCLAGCFCWGEGSPPRRPFVIALRFRSALDVSKPNRRPASINLLFYLYIRRHDVPVV